MSETSKDGEKDRKTNRKKDRQTDTPTHRHTERQTDKKTDRQMNKEYENVIYFYRNWWHQLIFEMRVYNIQNFSKMLISFFSLLADYLRQIKILILIRLIKNFKLTLCSSICSVQRQFIHWLLFSRGFRRWWADLLSLVLQRSKIYFWRPAARAYNSNDS